MKPKTGASRIIERWRLAVAPVLGVAALAGLSSSHARAEGEGSPESQATFNERCATRISSSILGTSASADMLDSPNPQAMVDVMLNSGVFFERFSRFVNASFNRESVAAPEKEPVYFLAKHVLTNGKPWSDLFVGKYNVDLVGTTGVQVQEDPKGLGYFRSAPWVLRYAGNEQAGIKISTAYRMMQNIVGLELVATTNAPDADISATGRTGDNCKGCHYTNWYALDKVAGVLSKKVVDPVDSQKITFVEYTGAPQSILGKASVGNDSDVVHALVDSVNFTFNTCRLSFKYLYGRAETSCEGPIFDECVNAFRSTGRVQSAIAAIAKNRSFCE